MTKQKHLMCKQPDRDCPGLVCGYPLPCPWHTATIEVSDEGVRLETGLEGATADEIVKLAEISKAFLDNEE